MNETELVTGAVGTVDVGEYCRRVEEFLTRVNGGHLVRIVGPGFTLVREWAADGIPLSVAFHGIAAKADRHRGGASNRPLRLEFCESDVREAFRAWRRAVGAFSATDPAADAVTAAPVEESRRPSLSKHLDRAIDRLTRAAGRLELSDAFRDGVTEQLGVVVSLRDEARKARGPARAAIAARLPAVDAALAAIARAAAPPELLAQVRREAEADLAAYRHRLSAEAWTRAIDVGVDHALRDRFGLPALDVAGL
ncbi:MAG TPA: hypothetical protein VFV98_07180 [Vicinamibacterales bacterium]|nr:hypothetical protein [Vicinamibacterales bacterium]